MTSTSDDDIVEKVRNTRNGIILALNFINDEHGKVGSDGNVTFLGEKQMPTALITFTLKLQSSVSGMHDSSRGVNAILTMQCGSQTTTLYHEFIFDGAEWAHFDQLMVSPTLDVLQQLLINCTKS